MFDQQAFVKAMGAVVVAFAQASTTRGHGGPSNLQIFVSHHLRHSPGEGIQW